jgi:hypothetical protein
LVDEFGFAAARILHDCGWIANVAGLLPDYSPQRLKATSEEQATVGCYEEMSVICGKTSRVQIG